LYKLLIINILILTKGQFKILHQNEKSI
jgi:hypothetical protein